MQDLGGNGHFTWEKFIMVKPLQIWVVDDLEDWFMPETPEEMLFTAILDRAIRDLNFSTKGVSAPNIRSAVKWFNGYHEDDCKNIIPYASVCEALNLSETIQKHITVAVEKAEEYLDERRKQQCLLRHRSRSERSLGTDEQSGGSVECRTMGSARRFAHRPKKRINTCAHMFRESECEEHRRQG